MVAMRRAGFLCEMGGCLVKAKGELGDGVSRRRRRTSARRCEYMSATTVTLRRRCLGGKARAAMVIGSWVEETGRGSNQEVLYLYIVG